MKFTVPCAKGCGGSLEVEEQTLTNAAALGVQLSVEHDVCPTGEPAEPGEAPQLRRFRVQFLMVEVPADPDNPDPAVTFPDPVIDDTTLEVMAGVGHTVEARNFAEAVNGPMTTWLNTAWPKMQEGAAYADLPAPTPSTPV